MHDQPFHPTLNTIPNLANLKNKKEIGTKLWNAITNKEEFQNLYTQSGTAILPIVIKSDNPQIQALPWELLYHPDYAFLATHPMPCKRGEERGAIGEIKNTLIASHAFLPLLFSQDIYNLGVNTPFPNMPPYGVGGFIPE